MARQTTGQVEFGNALKPPSGMPRRTASVTVAIGDSGPLLVLPGAGTFHALGNRLLRDYAGA